MCIESVVVVDALSTANGSKSILLAELRCFINSFTNFVFTTLFYTNAVCIHGNSCFASFHFVSFCVELINAQMANIQKNIRKKWHT